MPKPECSFVFTTFLGGWVADLQIIHSFLAAGVNALKISVQKCQKLSKIGPKLTKIGPKMSKIIQIWSKNYKKSQIDQLFLPAQIISGS